MIETQRLIRRRRDRAARSLQSARTAGMVGLTLTALIVGLIASGMAVIYLDVARTVPSVADIAAFFGDDGTYEPIRLVDRNGADIGRLVHPLADEAAPVASALSAPNDVIGQITAGIAVTQDADYWANRGYHWPEVIRSVLTNRISERPTITEQLIDRTLLPLPTVLEGGRRRSLQRALLAERLTQRFDKAQILDWYLNSADFGPYVWGIDSAAMVYFGVHAEDLDLGQAALLMSMPGAADSVMASPTAMRQGQREALDLLQAAGVIDAEQARQARNAPLEVLTRSSRPEFGPLQSDVIDHFVEVGGTALLERGGWTIQTTIDGDLQAQAACAMQTQVSRLSGEAASSSIPTASGEPCLAAGMLPPLRPGDAGQDHGVVGGAMTVMDPRSGEFLVRLQFGEVDERALPSGRMAHPFVYLTAFSRGLAPGTMVLDIPNESGDGAELASAYQGPVRMRTALADGLAAATERSLELAGLDNVHTTLRELGFADSAPPTWDELLQGNWPISIDEMTAAFSVIANSGLRVGAGEAQARPTLVQSASDRFGRALRLEPTAQRLVLSDGLAYLLLDVLIDDSNQGRLVGSSEAAGLGRPAAVLRSDSQNEGAWAVGFTPQRAVSVWLAGGEAEQPLTPENGPTSVLSAVLRYASLDLPPGGWSRPAQVAEVQVCDPSGLLPTDYCPETVTEVFLLGTEPTAFDNLYQPFRLNRRTGNLATLETPIEDVEVRVFLVPPPAAAAWADAAGIETPPSEYDALTQAGPDDPTVVIDAPEPFSIVSGEVRIQGHARPDGFSYYRLQFGSGLNPTRWTQIGEDHTRRVWGGDLEQWDTGGLNGLVTLQLIVARESGSIQTDSVALTIDNSPASIRVLQPRSGEPVELEADGTWVLDVETADEIGVGRIEVYLDNRLIESDDGAGSIWRLSAPQSGVHRLRVDVTDLAGNVSTTGDLELIFPE